MTLIDLETLKKQLTIEGVTTELSDEQLELLLTNVVNEIMGYTNVPIYPTSHKTILRDFDDDMLELDHYPVVEITSLKIGQTELSSDDYVLDEGLGILYFYSHLSGMLNVEYCCQVSDEVINNLINPLIFDIIRYRLTTNFSVEGAMSSVKEGDVQVNYDTSSSLGNLIQSRINDLKGLFSIRIKVL